LKAKGYKLQYENPEPHDHANFGPDDLIIRRVKRANHVTYDRNLNCDRLSSALFKFNDPSNYLSCDSGACLTANGINAVEYVLDGGWDGAVQMTVETFRSTALAGEPYRIGMAPLPGIPCHGAVWGKIRPGQANKLLALSNWLAEMPGVVIPGH
jgi:hypothetical protein